MIEGWSRRIEQKNGIECSRKRSRRTEQKKRVDELNRITEQKIRAKEWRRRENAKEGRSRRKNVTQE